MPKYRFRNLKDVEIEAENPEEAYKALEERCARNVLRKSLVDCPEDYELLGVTDPEQIDPELLQAAEKLSGFVVMSVQYRGENFAALCKVEDLGPEYVSVKPVALLLSEKQKGNLTDPLGNRPEEGLRKKLALE